MAKYAGKSTDFTSRRLASSVVVFCCLTDTSTDTTRAVDANRAGRRVDFGTQDKNPPPNPGGSVLDRHLPVTTGGPRSHRSTVVVA